jgi:competence protein ComGC
MKAKLIGIAKKYYPYFVDIWQYLIVILVVLIMLFVVIPSIKK